MKAESAVLFIVGSPLQLINAYEARDYFFRDADCDLVIGLSAEQQNNGQLDALLELLAWRHIYRVKAYGVLQPLRYHALANQMLRDGCGPYESIVIGEPYSVFFGIFAATIGGPAKTAYIDDGFTTLELAKDQLVGVKSRFYQAKLLLSRVCGLSISSAPTRDFFSAFPAAFNESTRWDLVGSNRYSWLRKTISKSTWLAELPNTVFFLGENLRECGMITNFTYSEIVRKMRLRFHNYEVVYLPHRREHPQNVEQLCKQLNMKKLHLETAVEAGFFLAGINPSIVVSLQSTALATLPIIYPTAAIYVIAIQNGALGNSQLESIVKDKHLYLRQLNCKTIQFLDEN